MLNVKGQKQIDEFYRMFSDEELIILESQHGKHPSSLRSYAAAKPVSTIAAFGSEIVRNDAGKISTYQMNPWEALARYQQEKKTWMFGYLGYGLKDYVETFISSDRPPQQTPDLFFMVPEILVSLPPGQDSPVVLLGDAGRDLRIRPADFPGAIKNFGAGISKAEYISNVKRIKKLIRDGEFYEMNYSYPLKGRFEGNPYWLYRRMRAINPVPFGSFIQTKDFSVCCSSPERFLKKEGSRVLSEPIKGTAGRAVRESDDRRSRASLMNEKNRAENLMIVDLVRHDLSRVAKTGSVKVLKLYDIQTFGTVHQLISTIGAEVEEQTHPVDVLRACFPMGSMTGAPKIRVMKAIGQFENYRRGIYSGAIGYFSPNGDFDFNVVIRSAILRSGHIEYPVGGAITSDSDPESEWEETKIKSRNITGVFGNHRFRDESMK